jgi:hypothetical protein
MESAPSAVAGADGWAGPNVLPFLKQRVIQRPKSDKLQGVWVTESPGITHTKQQSAHFIVRYQSSRQFVKNDLIHLYVNSLCEFDLSQCWRIGMEFACQTLVIYEPRHQR